MKTKILHSWKGILPLQTLKPGYGPIQKLMPSI